MYNFISVLSDSVKVGNIFVVSGYAGKYAQNLTVLLSCGKDQHANIALSLNTRFNDRKIIRSAIIGGSSMNEESSSGNEIANLSYENSMPLFPGEQFTFCILVGDDRFHISINDNPYCQYKFQIPVEQIRSLMIYGDIDALVKANHLKTFPFIFPNIQSDYEELAFEGFIPIEYSPGHLTIISGNVNGKSDGEFVIMFTQDESCRQLIHFNVRFDEMSVVMNTMDEEEGWSDNEVRTTNFPFRLGEQFKVAFAFTESELMVAVNGFLIINFPLHVIELSENENIWQEIIGIRVKNGVEMITNIERIEHIHLNDKSCRDFETYSA